MFCTRCGTETPDDSQFCRKCGLPLAAASRPLPPAQVPQKRKLVGPAFVLFLILVIGGWVVNNATRRQQQTAVVPKYSQSDAVDLVVQEIDEGQIRVTVFGRQNGVRITDIKGKASGGIVPDVGHCPSNSWGITFSGKAREDYSDMLPEETGHSVLLAYCVDKYSGAIKAGNDYAREFTTVPEIPQR
jgi:hypothetical protein